ncbi:MAG: hypothetical protein NDI90_15240 [Nitrospira sp. BO4]|jgi:chromosome segregation ATPase|nr:hypothetical protein [Nitrospira sp. BO4]
MQNKSASKTNPDVHEAYKRLAEAAETFVNRAPRQKRIEAERSALFEALQDAQLVLSVAGSAKKSGQDTSSRNKSEQNIRVLEDNLKQAKAHVAKSQDALEELNSLITPVATMLDELRDKTKKAQSILQRALKSPARV